MPCAAKAAQKFEEKNGEKTEALKRVAKMLEHGAWASVLLAENMRFTPGHDQARPDVAPASASDLYHPPLRPTVGAAGAMDSRFRDAKAGMTGGGGWY